MRDVDLVQGLLDAAAGPDPAGSPFAGWAAAAPDAATAVLEISEARSRAVALRPDAAASVDAVVRDVLGQALEVVAAGLVDAALTDLVSGLPLRRLFERDAARAIASAQRTGGAVSLVMIDVDGLKQVNDSRGHAAGDQHLRAVGEGLQEVVRCDDGAYRIGGDEFALLLPGGDDATARRVMARFVASAAPSVSWGVATAPEDGTTVGELLAAADRRMYGGRADRRVPATGRPAGRRLGMSFVSAGLAALVTASAALVAVNLTINDAAQPSHVTHAPRTATAPQPQVRRPATSAPRAASVTSLPRTEAAGRDQPRPSARPAVQLPVQLPFTLPTSSVTPPPPPGTVPTVLTDSVALLHDTVCSLHCRTS